MLNVAGVHALIEAQTEASGEIVVVKLTGSADPASMHALIAELQDLAHLRGTLRILVDETELHAGRVGFNEIAEIVHNWRTRLTYGQAGSQLSRRTPSSGDLTRSFRLLANLERKDSLNAFSKRADAVAWLVAEVAAAPDQSRALGLWTHGKVRA